MNPRFTDASTSAPCRVGLEVVVPVWNEEHRLGPTLDQLLRCLAQLPLTTRVTVVDNGSVDRTLDIVDARSGISPVPLRLIGCSEQGKGAAVRRGILASNAALVGFCDADLSTPLSALEPVLQRLLDGCDVVVASRRAPGGRLEVPQPLVRRLGSWGFRRLTRSMRGSVLDSQCGFKFFAESAGHELFRRSRATGFTFDLEIVALAQRLGMQVCEVPVRWSDAAGSSLSAVAEAPRILRELRTIRGTLARETQRMADRRLALSANPAG